MTDVPELPTFFRHGSVIYDLFPDVRPLTWSLWDRDGCIGEIILDQGDWIARSASGEAVAGRHAEWGAAVLVLLARPLA